MKGRGGIRGDCCTVQRPEKLMGKLGRAGGAALWLAQRGHLLLGTSTVRNGGVVATFATELELGDPLADKG